MGDYKSMTTGIYKIEGPNECVYIGSAVDINKRWASHRHYLRQGTHHSVYMQRHYTKYGIDNFTFSVLEECDADVLIAKEQEYLNKLFNEEPKSKRYNTLKVAYASTDFKHSDISKKIMSEKAKGRIITISARLKISEALSGRTHTKEHNKAVADSLDQTYNFTSPSREVITITNLKQFCAENSLNASHMYDVASGKRKTHKGWSKYHEFQLASREMGDSGSLPSTFSEIRPEDHSSLG